MEQEPKAPETQEQNGSVADTTSQEPKEHMIPKSRFDEVNTKYQELKTWREQQEKKQAEEQGQFKELAEKREQELAELREQHASEKRQTAIMRELQKLNPSNLDAALLLVDTSKVTIDEDGTITGADEAVKAVQELAPEFFTKTPPSDVGNPSGGNPDKGAKAKTYRASQLNDSKFVAENLEDIKKAEAEGRIKYDE